MERLRVLLRFATLSGLAFFALVVLILSDCSSGTLLNRSKQPVAVRYGSWDPYVLEQREGPIQWHTLGWPRATELGIVREAGGTYGHYVLIDITGGSRVVATKWSQKGVTVEFSEGHTLFIPKRSFIGGR